MPSEPPITGVRIRQQPGPSNGDGTNDARAWYYDRDPLVRAVVGPFIIEGTTDFTNFGLSTGVIIDRWCLAPGLAPYTERRVTHSGAFTAAVTYTDVDGVTSCAFTCTLSLSVTATPVIEGRGQVTAVAAGAQGPVLFSLDDFATPGLSGAVNPTTGNSEYLFADLRTGIYTISARETRANGCRATADVVLRATYGVLYSHTFKDADNVSCRVRIFERDYTGAVEHFIGQPEPVVLDWPGGATGHVYTTLLKGSECRLAMRQTVRDQFRRLFSGDERLHRVEYERAGTLLWKGFSLPEQYDAVFLPAQTLPPFNLSATDGLGTLSTIPFTGPAGQSLRGDWTLLQVIQYCLAKLELDLPLNVRLNLFPSTATVGTSAIEQVRFDVGQFVDSKGKPWDCGKIMQNLLQSPQCRLYQWAGAWWLERLRELTVEPMAYTTFDVQGVRGADFTLDRLHVIARGSALHWQSGGQRQQARGAVSTVTAEADPGELSNLLAYALPTNADLPGAVPQNWLSNTTTPTVPFSQLLYQSKDKAPILRLVGTTANRSTPLLAPWVQTPASAPLPLPFGHGNNHTDETFVLRMTLKPYGNTAADTTAGRSAFFVALHFGANWINGNVGAATESPTTVILQGTELPDDQEIKFVIRGFASAQIGSQPLYLRFYAPVGGASPATVDITDIRLEYDDFNPEVADFVATYTTNTGELVSRVDEETLFHIDTPHARYPGSLLDANGLPTQGWFEAGTPGQVREMGDWFVVARNLFQRAPAQALTGKLRGLLNGPGALLTDPAESTPGVYLLPGCTHNAAKSTWDVDAVQLITLTPPVQTLPENAIYNEDAAETAWQSEAGSILVYENA